MGGRTKNPYGRLGERAGFHGHQQAWQAAAQKRLSSLYLDDLDVITIETRYRAIAVEAGHRDMQENLETVRRDYASYWLLRQMKGEPLPALEMQGEYWHSALIAAPDRQLALTLACAGFDIVTPRLLDGDPVLHGFAFQADADDMEEFLGFIPPAHRASQLNQWASGMTPVHAVAVRGGQGALTLMQAHGADLTALTDITIGTGETLRGNVAHLAVLGGHCDTIAELMALDRSLFTRYDLSMKYMPDEVAAVCAGAGVMPGAGMRRAANLAAFARDHVLPFPEDNGVLARLSPLTAPRPVLLPCKMH